MEGSVTYLSPAWGLAPNPANKFHAVHCRVGFSDESTLPVEVKHNLALPYGAPLQEPEWITPLVLVNPLTGGPSASAHTLKVIDGNTVAIGRAASGAGTFVTYDVWIFRPTSEGSWFSRL